MISTRLFWEYIDGGHGKRILLVNRDTREVFFEELVADNGYYTGIPKRYIGKKTKEIKGFWRKFRESKNENQIFYWLEVYSQENK